MFFLLEESLRWEEGAGAPVNETHGQNLPGAGGKTPQPAEPEQEPGHPKPGSRRDAPGAIKVIQCRTSSGQPSRGYPAKPPLSMSSARGSPGSMPLLEPAVPCGRLPAGARCRRAAAPPARAAGAGLGLAHFDRHPGARPSPDRRQGGGPARPRGRPRSGPQPARMGAAVPRSRGRARCPRSVSPGRRERRELRQREPRARLPLPGTAPVVRPGRAAGAPGTAPDPDLV